MQILKRIALAIVALLALLLIYAATKPDTFEVRRSTTISAPPERVFALINDLKAFNSWNPWVRKEPSALLEYQGPASGVGAAYTWQGKESGAGRMEVIAAEPSAKLQMKLDFSKPFEAHNQVSFSLAPQGNTTQVTWAMGGPMPFINKLMTTFFDMDKMVGTDFEAGLANLKAAAEKAP